MRVHWYSGNEWFPTKKGIRLDMVHALAVTDGLYQILHGTLPAAPTNGTKPHRNGRKRDNTGLPGPTPPRNSAGGFKVVGVGAIKYGWCLGSVTEPAVRVGKDACDPYDFKPAVFIPPWVKYVIHLAGALRAA